ncbi:MAG: hypothetical protein JSS27_12230 [Planctomycetes bacterium]|nr:hypothetical protein [Planctomycetota bacterium]
MRRELLILCLLAAVCVAGGSAGDLLPSFLGGKSSDQADLNKLNEKNRYAQGINP